MARRTKEFMGTEERDKGKRFQITEMSALRAERWVVRLFLALANAGVEVPDGAMEQGMAGLKAVMGQALGAIGKLPEDIAMLLWDEMLDCVTYQHGNNPPMSLRTLEENNVDIIEEVQTLFQLRLAVLELHTGFSLAGKRQKSGKVPASPA